MEAQIIQELGKGEEFAPVIGAGMNEATKINLQALIDALYLPVHLWMVWRAHVELSPDDP